MRLPLITSVALLAALTGAGVATAATTSQQDFFTAALQKDAKVTTTIKAGLTAKQTFVDPSNLFADVTGDKKADAIVLVESGTINGAVALYVFTTDGGKSSKLRVAYRSQSLQRATARVQGTSLIIRTPAWRAGDDPCCALRYSEATYVWNAARQTMVRTAVHEVPASVTGA